MPFFSKGRYKSKQISNFDNMGRDYSHKPKLLKMKSVKIGCNLNQENIYKARHQHAQNVLNQAKAFVSELIPLDTLETDIETFKQSFSGYVQTFIKNDSVLKRIDTSSIINLTALQTLEKRYHEYKQPDKVSFDIFATTEHQVTCFEYSLKLCELLNQHPQQIELRHQLRNSSIPLVDISTDTFIPDSIAISMLK
jgi:hypothetical protein